MLGWWWWACAAAPLCEQAVIPVTEPPAVVAAELPALERALAGFGPVWVSVDERGVGLRIPGVSLDTCGPVDYLVMMRLTGHDVGTCRESMFVRNPDASVDLWLHAGLRPGRPVDDVTVGLRGHHRSR
jgi:hypothetical protein